MRAIWVGVIFIFYSVNFITNQVHTIDTDPLRKIDCFVSTLNLPQKLFFSRGLFRRLKRLVFIYFANRLTEKETQINREKTSVCAVKRCFLVWQKNKQKPIEPMRYGWKNMNRITKVSTFKHVVCHCVFHFCICFLKPKILLRFLVYDNNFWKKMTHATLKIDRSTSNTKVVHGQSHQKFGANT